MHELYLTAVENNNTESLKNFEKKKKFNHLISNWEGNTAFHYAAQNNNLTHFSFLVERYGFQEPTNRSGITPLFFATINYDSDFFNFLLDLGANKYALDRNGNSILHYNLEHSPNDNISFLICDSLMDVNKTNKFGESPLHISSKFSKIASSAQLLNSGANPNLIDENGNTPLHLAVIAKSPKLVNLLIQYKATPTIPNQENLTPLALAIDKSTISGQNDSDIIISLLNYDSIDNYSDYESSRFLSYAALAGQFSVVKELLDKGLKPTYEAMKLSIRPLPIEIVEERRVKDSKYAICLLLFENGYPKGKTEKRYISETHKKENLPAIHLAARYGNIDILKYLVKHNISTNLYDSWGETPLHRAARKGHIESVKFLFQHNASPNSKIIFSQQNAPIAFNDGDSLYNDVIGSTPLHLAAKKGNTAIVKILVENGAQINVRESNNDSPLSLSFLKGKFETGKQLVELGANVSFKQTDIFQNSLRNKYWNIIDYYITEHSFDYRSVIGTASFLKKISSQLSQYNKSIEEYLYSYIRDIRQTNYNNIAFKSDFESKLFRDDNINYFIKYTINKAKLSLSQNPNPMPIFPSDNELVKEMVKSIDYDGFFLKTTENCLRDISNLRYLLNLTSTIIRDDDFKVDFIKGTNLPWWIAIFGELETYKLLYQKGLDVNLLYNNEHSALYFTLLYSNLDFSNQLIGFGAKFDEKCQKLAKANNLNISGVDKP